MLITVLLTLVATVFFVRIMRVFRTQNFVFSRTMAYATAIFVWANLGFSIAIELLLPATVLTLWAQIISCGAVAIILTVRYRHMHLHRKVRLGFQSLFACYFVSMAGLSSSLIILASRLHPAEPFSALIVGVLSVFMPIHSIAEVLHQDLQQNHRIQQNDPQRATA